MKERHRDIASALPADLDSLPRLRGFRLRGMEMTRLETFIDAAFAFAISMLVIAAQQIPDNIQALLAAFKNVPTFVCSIAVLGIFWRGHWLWSRRYGLEDSVSIFISWALIVTILIFIYPLKSIFGAMWYFITDGRIGQPFSLHTTEAQARAIFVIYALGLIAIAAEILFLHLRAWQLREPLRLNARERLMTRGELTGWSIPIVVGPLWFGAGDFSFVVAATLLDGADRRLDQRFNLIALPIVHVSVVAWIATRSPPPQPCAIFGWWAGSARMQQP